MAVRVDSRRLPGASLFGDAPGAILDLRLAEGDDPEALVRAWTGASRLLFDELGWREGAPASRRSRNDLSLFLPAPEDCLYAATEVNEAAWAAASGDGPAIDD